MRISFDSLADHIECLPAELIDVILAKLPLGAMIWLTWKRPRISASAIHCPEWKHIWAKSRLNATQEALGLYTTLHEVVYHCPLRFNKPPRGNKEIDEIFFADIVTSKEYLEGDAGMHIRHIIVRRRLEEMVRSLIKSVPLLERQALARVLPDKNNMNHWSENFFMPASASVPQMLEMIRRFAYCEDESGKRKAAEVRMLATLYQKHSDKLKGAWDPSQTPRDSVNHIAARLNGVAARLLRRQVFTERSKRRRPRYPFKAEHAQFVPYDRWLKIFVHIIEIQGQTDWPAEVAMDVSTVINALPYVYPRTDGRLFSGKRYHRTANTPWSTRDPAQVIPAGILNDISKAKFEERARKRQIRMYGTEACFIPQTTFAGSNQAAHDLREVAFLIAFIRCCEYFESHYPSIVESVPVPEPPVQQGTARQKRHARNGRHLQLAIMNVRPFEAENAQYAMRRHGYTALWHDSRIGFRWWKAKRADGVDVRYPYSWSLIRW